MPRITRVEPTVAYQPSNMPTASGDWGGPGRALSGLGNAIGGLAGAVTAERAAEDDYKAKLELVKFQTTQHQEYETYKNTYSGDPSQFQSGWDAKYNQAWSNFTPSLPQDPKVQRYAGLHGAEFGGRLSSQAQQTQHHMVGAQNYANVEATINATLGSIDSADPDRMDQVLSQTIAGLNQMIDQAPPGVLTDAQKKAMRTQASGLAIAKMEQKFRDAKIDPMPALQGTVNRWLNDPNLQSPQPYGGQAGVAGGFNAPLENRIIEGQSGAVRSKPISGDLRGVLNRAANDAGVTVEVYSGGQDEAGPNRTGSRRHDHGNAADLKLYTVTDGKKALVDFTTPAGEAIYRKFVSSAVSAGATGIGADVGYMGSSSIHVGFGNQATWGAGGRGASAPAWLREAYESGQRVSQPAGGDDIGAPKGTSPETINAVKMVAGNIGADPRAIAGVFSVESQGWNGARTGKYRGVSQVGPDTLAEMGVLEAQYDRMSQAEQAAFYGKWLEHYKFKDKMASAGIDFARLPPTRQAAILQAFQFAPNGDWVKRLGSGDDRTPVTDTRQARALGSTSIADMERHFSKSVPAESRQPSSQPVPMAQRAMTAGHPAGKDNTISAERYDPRPNESGVPRDLEREHYRLTGDDTSKAKQLREIIASGRQNIVHQLDADGNDVVAVKKGDKPSWSMNAVTKDAQGNVGNALDKGDAFSGPKWAKDIVADLKAGKPVQVADASGGLPTAGATPGSGDTTIGAHGVTPDLLQRMRPSVQSEMMQSLSTHWKAWEGLQNAWVKDIEGRARSALDVAQSGYEPKASDLAVLKAMIDRSPDVARKYGLDQIMGMIETTVAKQQTVRQMTPMAIEGAIQRMDGIMATGGASPQMIEEKKTLEKSLATMRKEIDDDPISWAAKAKIPISLPMPSLEPGARAGFEAPWTVANATPINFGSQDVVSQLRMRGDIARGVGDYYNQPPQFFTKVEREMLKDVFRGGGAQMLQVLGKIHEGLGSDAVLAMKEFAKDAPEAAMMGKLMAEGGDAKLLEDAAKGLHLRVAEGDKFISRVDKKITEPDVSALMPALARTPGLVDPAIRMASAVYEYRHRYLGKDAFDSTLYTDTLKEVLGQSKDKDGNIYGGVGKHGTWWKSSVIVVPPNVRQDKFDDVVGAIRDVDLKTLGSPRHGDGTPLVAAEVRQAKWESVGNGRYGIVLGTNSAGEALYAWDTERNRPFVLDLSLIMPGLKKRAPGAFRP